VQPPPRAAYVVDTTSPYTAVVMNADADAVLARAAAEATRRLGPSVLLNVWLDAGSDEHVRVHLGEHEIGTLPDAAARLFATDLGAATELFDESLRVRATLTPASPGRSALLEIGTPKQATSPIPNRLTIWVSRCRRANYRSRRPRRALPVAVPRTGIGE
jgi:hypothetical protein